MAEEALTWQLPVTTWTEEAEQALLTNGGHIDYEGAWAIVPGDEQAAGEKFTYTLKDGTVLLFDPKAFDLCVVGQDGWSGSLLFFRTV